MKALRQSTQDHINMQYFQGRSARLNNPKLEGIEKTIAKIYNGHYKRWEWQHCRGIGVACSYVNAVHLTTATLLTPIYIQKRSRCNTGARMRHRPHWRGLLGSNACVWVCVSGGTRIYDPKTEVYQYPQSTVQRLFLVIQRKWQCNVHAM
jgi:hypothetical protein